MRFALVRSAPNRFALLRSQPGKSAPGPGAGVTAPVVQAEGHTVLVIDDAHELCAGLNLRDQIDSVLTLGRSAAISCIVASGDTGYVPSSQATFKFTGHISSIDAAKAGTGKTPSWPCSRSSGCISMTGPASPGPCRFTAESAAIAV